MTSTEYLSQAHYSLLRDITSQPNMTLMHIEKQTGICMHKLRKVFGMIDLFTNSELDKLQDSYPFLLVQPFKREDTTKRAGLFKRSI